MDMPPTRLRVVERGRRLEVIDTGGGEVRRVGTAHPREPGEARTPGLLPRQVRFDGTKRWTTHRLYDAKAPRTVTLDPGRAAFAAWLPVALAIAAMALAALVALAPWTLFAAGALFNPKTRQRLRGWSTRAIDRLAADEIKPVTRSPARVPPRSAPASTAASPPIPARRGNA